jgi:hypothetical protein
MKKAFTLLVLIVSPTLAFAQGTVVFNNDESELVKQETSFSDPTLTSVPVGAGHVELLAAPARTAFTPFISFGGVPNYPSLEGWLAANPGWADIATTGIQPVAGRFNGGTVTLPTAAPGANAEYVIIGWTGSFATLDAAIASSSSLIGSSPMVTTATGNPTTTPPGPPVSLADTFSGITFGWGCLDGYFGGFTAQPTSQTVVLGATVIFSVGADACPSPYYQWYFNGVPIPGATRSSLQITNAQLTNAGPYWVVLSNAAWLGPFSGSVYASSNAILTVLAPPTITQPPQSQTAIVGSSVDFRASAAGLPPLAYQWFFNTTTALSGGTNLVLRLTNVQPAQAGAYTLVVTNITGAVTSAPAVLSVIPPVEQRMVPGLSLLGQPGSLLNLESANTLGPAPAWVTLESVILTNATQWYFDVSEPLPPQRFYRAWQTNGPSVIPTLRLYMVQAITLTGTIGHSVRLDYINQFGPTDAWVTLDTVTLTNTSQLYFDASSIGQPARLWRIVRVP